MKTLLASSITLLLMAVLAITMTHGFTVFTQEQARKMFIVKHQPRLPHIQLINANGQSFFLDDWVLQQNKLIVVNLIYTRCNAICKTAGNEFQQLQRIIQSEHLQDRISLFTVSFDPNYDKPQVLAAYSHLQRAENNIWQFATVHNNTDLPALLDFFGIVVIADEWGGFQHNNALLAVRSNAHLFDVDNDFATTQRKQNDYHKLLSTWLQQNPILASSI